MARVVGAACKVWSEKNDARLPYDGVEVVIIEGLLGVVAAAAGSGEGLG